MHLSRPRRHVERFASSLGWLLCAAGSLAGSAEAQFPGSRFYGFNPQTNEIFRSTTTDAGQSLEVVAEAFSALGALDFDAEGNLLWGAIADWNGVNFSVLDVETGIWSQRSFFAGQREIGDLVSGRFVENGSSPWFFSSPDAAAGTTEIFRGDVRSGEMSSLALVPGNLTCLALIRNSRLLAYRESPSELLQIDTLTGAFTAVDIASQVVTVSSLDFDTASGQLFGVMADAQGRQWFGRLDPATGAVEFLEDLTSHGAGLRIAIRRGERPLDSVKLCDPGTVGSSGQPARLEALGSADIERNDLLLQASGLPSSTFGLFMASLTSRSPVMPAASIGNLCLGGDVGRITDGGQAFSTQGAGFFDHPLDLSAIAQPNGAAAAAGLDTWAFQAWFRDSTGGAPVSNFTNAIEVSFNGEADPPVFTRPALRFAWFTHMVAGDMTGNGRADMVGGGFGTHSGRGLFIVSADPESISGVSVPYRNINVGEVVGLDLADLDNDGDLDVVVATRSSPLLRAFLNDGTGGLSVSYQNGVCVRPTLARVADLDGDGFMDVALGCTSERLKVLFGLGDGTFTLGQEFTFPEDAADVALIDLNGNGRSEIVSLLTNASEIEVRPVSALRVIGPPTRYSVGPGSLALAAVDQDLDGNIDVLALRTAFGAVALLRGAGAGSLLPSVDIHLGPEPVAMAVTDIDHDGRPDLLTSERSNSSMQRWMNVGPEAYSFGGEETFGYEPAGVVSADMDGDGLLEVVVTGESGFTTVIPGTSVLNPPDVLRQPMTLRPDELVSGDFDGDGHLDLLAIGPTTMPVIFYPGLGDGTFGQLRAVPNIENGGSWTSAIDVDLDGDLDVITSPSQSGALKVSLNDGSAGFTQLPDISLGALEVIEAIAEDFTGDGVPDLAVGTQEEVRLYAGGGAGGFALSQAFPLSGDLVGMDSGDLNGDGRPDLGLLTDHTFGASAETAEVMLNSGSALTAPVLVLALTGQSVAFERPRLLDIDGDHLDDLLVYGRRTSGNSPDRLFIYPGRGDGTFSPPEDPPIDARFHDFLLADVDQDGRADMIGVVNSPGGLGIQYGSRVGTRWKSEWHPVIGLTVAAYGDFNGDGFLDAVVSSRYQGTMTTFLNVAYD